MSNTATRLEHDLLGDKAVPADAYYGVQTARALENFHISGVQLQLYPNLIKAFAMVKMAAARANFDCGQFSKEILTGMEGACREIIDGKPHDQFRLDVFQGGAGTSTNMNANEVIANRALELMGHKKGEYKHCDPHDHANCSQSTNDAYPSSLHVGMALGNQQLVAAVNELVEAFRKKGKEFGAIVSAQPADIVVNCTSVGLHDPSATFKELPFQADDLSAGCTVVDMVYRNGGTLLLNTARANGAEVVDGLEILVAQGAASLERWTGRTAPDQAMREAVADFAS